MKTYKARLRDGFRVSQLLKELGYELDFIYSYEDGVYRLLNDDLSGVTDAETVNKQKQLNKIIIIDNRTLELVAYNFDDDVIEQAIIK